MREELLGEEEGGKGEEDEEAGVVWLLEVGLSPH